MVPIMNSKTVKKNFFAVSSLLTTKLQWGQGHMLYGPFVHGWRLQTLAGNLPWKEQEIQFDLCWVFFNMMI